MEDDYIEDKKDNNEMILHWSGYSSIMERVPIRVIPIVWARHRVNADLLRIFDGRD